MSGKSRSVSLWGRLVVALLVATFLPQLITGASHVAAEDPYPCPPPPYANEIVEENCQPGSPPSVWDISGAGDPRVQGFATDISVNRGGTIRTISFKIGNTDPGDGGSQIDPVAPPPFRIDIYRLGYYGGDGARLVHTIPSDSITLTDQPACLLSTIVMGGGATTSGQLLDCGNWSVSASWEVPTDATSGVYIAKPTLTDVNDSGASHIPFIVRDDGGNSELLFQTSDTTWQSYNPYGGYNAYGSSGAVMAEKLSYNRPFATRGAELENYLFNAEYPMIRWLERNGYDVSYFSAVDTERNSSLITNHEVFLSVGHDEYWSQGRRDAVTAARDAGVHLAFFSANEIYWKTRWEASTADGGSTDYRTQVVYKEGSSAPSGAAEHRNCSDNYECDPSTIWTGQWREAPSSTPENSLSGQISWRLNEVPITVPSEYAPLRFWRNTDVANLTTGEVTLADGTLGYEWDPEYPEFADWYPAGRVLLSTTTATSFVGYPEQHHMSLYRVPAPSGALVFGAGTVQWSWGLDPVHDRDGSSEDENMQQATVNLLADMGVQPANLQTNLVAATASTDTAPPTVTVTSPASGASIPGGAVTITGTAEDVDGAVGVVEISTDGGTTWRRATGRANWSYTYVANEGAADIRIRAADDSINLSAPILHTFTVEPRVCPCSVWDDSVVRPLENDPAAVELGVKFQVTEPGTITAIRFYKHAENTGEHSGRIWSSDGSLLGSVVFTGETDSGWQQAQLTTPVNVVPGVTYVASYHTATGYYAQTENFFTEALENSPLRLPADGEAGVGANGVYIYTEFPGYFPVDTSSASNYWVDVVFTPSGPDTTPPLITQVFPQDGATGVAVASPVTVRFNEPVQNVTGATFTLTGPGGAVGATVSYNPANLTATLTPAVALSYNAEYTAEVMGGAGGVEDLAENDLAATETWTFTTGSEPVSPEQGPGGPILVVAEPGTIGRYYAEILRNEGLNLFAVDTLANVNATLLADYRAVILAEQAVDATQAGIFGTWVNGGGVLVAMRPDANLAGLLGISPAEGEGTLVDGYLQFIGGTPVPVSGLVGETIQFHGTADYYTLNGASQVAELYSNATTPAGYPAVTHRAVGSGAAIAFTYDLANSVVLTRQGNPVWAGINGDGSAGPVRADDMFHNGTAPDWIDLNKVAIPQADEQQRLLANALVSSLTLPRFWYFPRMEKAVVILTGDDHGNGYTDDRFARHVTQSLGGCSVANWECVRSTSYIYPGSISDAVAESYTNQGFEVSIHVSTGCADWTPSSLRANYAGDLGSFATLHPSIPAPATHRTHCIAWSDYATQPVVELENGIRLDTNYYYWPGDWILNRPGMFTGSGMPMRFTTEAGGMVDVYQATTQLTDESGQTYPATINALLDKAIGTEGYYGAFTANIHTDSAGTDPLSDAIVTSAQARGVPIVSARQMLEWLDGRNGSAFENLSWNDGFQLSFSVQIGSGANGLQVMIPAELPTQAVQDITLDGVSVTYQTETIKGMEYAIFPAAAGDYQVTYAAPTADIDPPVINSVSPAQGSTTAPINTSVSATFNEPMNPATVNASTFELRAPGNILVPATVTYDTNTNTAILTPNEDLDLDTTYSATVFGSASGVTDVAGNPLAADYNWSFTTVSGITIFGDTPGGSQTNDNGDYELGVKFRSDTDGYITGVRFYKPDGATGTHIGKLWDGGGTLLASAAFVETASGWQEVSFANPLAITANTTYIASYSWPGGFYSYVADAFLNSGVTNGPLTALQSGVDGPNGVYNETPGAFPEAGAAANYFADVIFQYEAPPDATPPVVDVVSPADGAIDVSTGADITATFSEAMDPATINSSTFELRAPGDVLVPATVSYDTGSNTATLTPNSSLLPNSSYAVTVKGGTSGVKDLAGNALAADEVWSFTTAPQSVGDTTVSDFELGTLGDNCDVNAYLGDGSLSLSPTVLGFEAWPITGWTSHIWNGEQGPFIEDNQLTLDGSVAYTPGTATAEFGPGTTLEFRATFSSQPFQHVGFGQINQNDPAPFNSPAWIMFSTSNDGLAVYARVLPNGSTAFNTGNDKISLGSDYRNAPHDYRIDWKSNSIDFYVDGDLKETVAQTIASPMRIAASDYNADATVLSVDTLRLPPYGSPCIFTSRVFDAGEPVQWGAMTWQEILPTTDTSTTYRVRMGNTADPDGGSWTAYQTINSSGDAINVNSRYIQYQVELSTTDPEQTPVVEEVRLAWPAYIVTATTTDNTGVGQGGGQVPFRVDMTNFTNNPLTIRAWIVVEQVESNPLVWKSLDYPFTIPANGTLSLNLGFIFFGSDPTGNYTLTTYVGNNYQNHSSFSAFDMSKGLTAPETGQWNPEDSPRLIDLETGQIWESRESPTGIDLFRQEAMAAWQSGTLWVVSGILLLLITLGMVVIIRRQRHSLWR